MHVGPTYKPVMRWVVEPACPTEMRARRSKIYPGFSGYVAVDCGGAYRAVAASWHSVPHRSVRALKFIDDLAVHLGLKLMLLYSAPDRLALLGVAGHADLVRRSRRRLVARA